MACLTDVLAIGFLMRTIIDNVNIINILLHDCVAFNIYLFFTMPFLFHVKEKKYLVHAILTCCLKRHEVFQSDTMQILFIFQSNHHLCVVSQSTTMFWVRRFFEQFIISLHTFWKGGQLFDQLTLFKLQVSIMNKGFTMSCNVLFLHIYCT